MFRSMAAVRGALLYMKPTSATNYRKVSQSANLHLLSRPDTWQFLRTWQNSCLEISAVFVWNVGGYFVASIVTCYRLDSLGFQARCVWIILRLSRPALGPTMPPVQWILGQGKTARVWCWPTTPRVKERVELYLYSCFGPLWLVLGWTLPLLWNLFLSYCK
jgi:hypothetical protein